MQITNLKGKGSKLERKRDTFALYFSVRNISINASARDFLNDCDYIDIEFENNEIIIKSGTEFKIAKAGEGLRSFSTVAFLGRGRVAKIPAKTKLFGVEKDGALHFAVPKKYINQEFKESEQPT